jgi:DNA-binding protein H-NS
MDIKNLTIEQKIELLNQLKEDKIEYEYRKAGKKKVADLLREKKQKIADIEKTYAIEIATISKQYGLADTSGKTEVSAEDNQGEDKRKGKKPMLYRDPDNIENEWSGQGMMPKWLKPLIENWGITSKQFKDLSIDDAALLEQVKQYHINPSENQDISK